MLLGCCHCGEEPPSESISESESVSSSEAPIETIIGSCGTFPVIRRCLNKVAPVRYVVQLIDPGGATAICQPSYMGSFTLFFTSGTCFGYLSAELVRKLNGATCEDHTNGARFRLSIGGAVSGGNTQFSLQAVYLQGGFEVAIASYSLNAGAIDIDCVNSFTLTKGSTDSLGFAFPTTVVITPL